MNHESKILDKMEYIRCKLVLGDIVDKELKDFYNRNLKRTQEHYKEMNQYWQDEKPVV